MGLAKIAPDGWAYYAREIAAGMEDYFVGHGEETGRWVGRGAETLGLSGPVDSDGLSRLFGHGVHPVSGVPLGRPFGSDKTAVAGYALSFSPPKSVSVLWALAPAEIADQVRESHDAAVAAALEFLQDHASFTRRGHGGAVQEATEEHVGLAYAVTVRRSQGLTVDHAVVVVDRSTSAEHLYVAMSRGRHHNLACVVTEPAGDEHTQRPAPTAEEVLAAALRRTSGEKSATETLRDELGSLQPETGLDRRHAIVEGLRQTQNHSYQETIRRQAQHQANPHPGRSPAPSITRGGPEL